MTRGGENLLVFIGLFAILALFCWPVVYWGLRHARFTRELEHAERLRALECGETLPKDRGVNPGVAIGVAVPCTTFGVALVASFCNAGLYAWPAAGAVGVAAVICGTILALNPPPPPPRRPGPPLSRDREANAKPALDPDAIDVVGRRG